MLYPILIITDLMICRSSM